MEYSSPALALPKQVDIKPMQGGFGFLIPCDATSQQGELTYFTTAYNKFDNPVARSGSMEKPRKLKIKVAINSAQPHLPGELPPRSCTDGPEEPRRRRGAPAGTARRGPRAVAPTAPSPCRPWFPCRR